MGPREILEKIEPRLIVGTKQIAVFLGVHVKTASKYCQGGKLPARRDPLGRWTLWNVEYYESLTRSGPRNGNGGGQRRK